MQLAIQKALPAWFFRNSANMVGAMPPAKMPAKVSASEAHGVAWSKNASPDVLARQV